MTPPPFTIVRAHAPGPFVIFCDHASNHVPAELNQLGVPPAELARHIAWDIGAAGVATELSALLDSPAILCGTSRLVIDCNRHLDASDLIPEQSDATIIPGNRQLSPDARRQRIERYFTSYHAAVEEVFRDRETRGVASISLSIHSMTDNLAGSPRPWEISFSSDSDRTLVEPVIERLRDLFGIESGDNQPYSMDPAVDYSTPYHALRRGLRYLQVEFRQDAIADETGQVLWARRLADAVRGVST